MNILDSVIKYLTNLISTTSELESVIKTIEYDESKNITQVDFDFAEKTIDSILIDKYCLNSKDVKSIADIIMKRNVRIGRKEKDLIKAYLDYGDSYLSDLYTVLEQDGLSKEEIDLILYKTNYSDDAKKAFINNWNDAVLKKDESKKHDYVLGIYSKLVYILNPDLLSLKDIFSFNEKELKKELSNNNLQKVKEFCDDDKKDVSYKTRRKFYDFYINLLREDLIQKSNGDLLENEMNKSFSKNTIFEKLETESYGLVLFEIDQKLYDLCDNDNSFYSLVLNIIRQTYRLLENHKSFSIKISNIFNENGQNLKWYLYSYIGIFAEHFIPLKEKRKFYDGSKLAINRYKYFNKDINEETIELLKSYFLGTINLDELNRNIKSNIPVKEIVMDFENIWYGYTFADCIGLNNGNFRQNSEIDFINNNNEILMIFNKYRHDDRKIPCPDCASFKISGNSFPEVGLRSWECKNESCSSRSKSNRGKRYSFKSNFMQFGFEDGIDTIDKKFIYEWRRDIVKGKNSNDVYEMLVRYFSFSGENVLFINSSNLENNFLSRNITNLEINIGDIAPFCDDEFINYFSEGYVKRFNFEERSINKNKNETIINLINNSKNSVLINGDSKNVLSQIPSNYFTTAVTSPPYYNAREYSQWPDLYLYLIDMYKIIKETYRTIKNGGTYLYNIGDICGNENTVVNSTMGNKRILLGSYTIFLFIKAGFELLDNILWDKGEPQSNRHKNDGKFTPYYQKPMNVYEHMFIFKKPGDKLIKSDKTNIPGFCWNKNIVEFSPVIKINNKKENKLGHTAPFPLDIPDFVNKAFTTNEECLVLEPFAGSGTSILSSFENGRRCIGIELSNEYSNLIKKICNDNGVPLDFIKLE